MPPSTRSARPSAPPDRVYESISPLAQARLPPMRQRVYGRHGVGAPLTKKRQGTLTQIGFVNPEKIDDEIAEYEQEEMERNAGKRRKTETPLRRGLKAKSVIGQRGTPLSGARLRYLMENDEIDREDADVVREQMRQEEVPIQRLDDTPEPETDKGRSKKKRKSRQGIKIGVKIVTIKIESPESQRQATQIPQHNDEQETQGEGVDMVMDSFQAAPSFEEEGNYENYVQVQAEPASEMEKRRNRVIPDSDVESESEDESIVYDSNDEKSNTGMEDATHEQLDELADNGAANGGSDVDLDEIKDSLEDKAGSEQDLDESRDSDVGDTGELNFDLTREIPDSQAESEDEEDIDVDVVDESQHELKEGATLILNSFSVPPTGGPRENTKGGPNIIPDSFSVPGSPTVEQQPAIIQDSFYHKPAISPQKTSASAPTPPAPSPIPEGDVKFVPSSSAVSIPEGPLPNLQENPATMPPPKTPTKLRRTEIPNTGSTCSPLSTQSTLRSMTPSSARSKIYNRSPSKTYNRSPLKRLSENNVFSLSLPRLSQSPSKKSASLQLRESQISTQGTPTQRSRVSQLSSIVKPELEAEVDVEEDEPTIIPNSPTPMKTERNDSQYTADTNSPSRQIHSEISAALSSEQDHSSPSSRRTITFVKTEIKDSQAESDDEDMDIEVESDRVQVPSSPKPLTPRVVRFQSIPADIPPQLHSSPVVPRSSPVSGSTDTHASRPSIVGAETQMRSQWLGSDELSSGPVEGPMGESQWLGDLLPESLMLGEDELSIPPILDDDSVWDEFRSSR